MNTSPHGELVLWLPLSLLRAPEEDNSSQASAAEQIPAGSGSALEKTKGALGRCLAARVSWGQPLKTTMILSKTSLALHPLPGTGKNRFDHVGTTKSGSKPFIDLLMTGN